MPPKLNCWMRVEPQRQPVFIKRINRKPFTDLTPKTGWSKPRCFRQQDVRKPVVSGDVTPPLFAGNGRKGINIKAGVVRTRPDRPGLSTGAGRH